MKPSSNRREFLGSMGAAAAALLPAIVSTDAQAKETISRGYATRRATQCLQVKRNAALANAQMTIPVNLPDGDEAQWPNTIVSYHKGLPHNEIGEVEPQAYRRMLHALTSGRPADFEKIELGGNTKLSNPQGGLAFDVAWGDSSVRSVELQAKDNDSPQNGGGHPWNIEPGTTSTLLLFNHSANESKRFNVSIGSRAQTWQRSYQLASMETKAISINDIVANQVADEKGRVLSKDLVTGQVSWFTRSPKWGKGRLMVSQPQSGLARSFSCGVCSDVCPGGFIDPDLLLNTVVAGTGNLGDIIVSLCSHTCTPPTCGGTNIGDTTDVLYTWSSLNTSVATVSGGTHLAHATFLGAAPGATYGKAKAQGDFCFAQAQGPVTVAPSISSISPNWGKAGTNVAVTISGTGFGTAPTVSFAGTGITVAYVTRSNTTITATFTIASSAPIGMQGISVTNNTQVDGGHQTSSPVNFQVTPASATPVNFRQTAAQDVGNGDLDVTYKWDSSTGNLNDLSACTIGEYVAYPTPPGVDYQPPSPPWPANSPFVNPTIISGPATSTGFLDHHWLGQGITGASFKKPYSASSFIASQYYWYSCSGGNVIHWKDNLVITRSVSANGAGGWKFRVTASDTSTAATINPLP